MNKKKVISTFQGKFCYCNQDVIETCLSKKTIPSDQEYFELEQLKLIKDYEHNTTYLVADFASNCEWHGFTIKAFLYEDKKAFGSLIYVAECKVSPAKIEAKFIKLKDGYLIYGSIITPGYTGKEGFLLHTFNKMKFIKSEIKHITILKEKVNH